MSTDHADGRAKGGRADSSAAQVCRKHADIAPRGGRAGGCGARSRGPPPPRTWRSSTLFCTPRRRASSSPSVTLEMPPTRSESEGFFITFSSSLPAVHIQVCDGITRRRCATSTGMRAGVQTAAGGALPPTACRPQRPPSTARRTVRGGNQLDAALRDGASGHALGLRSDLVDHDDLRRVVVRHRNGGGGGKRSQRGGVRTRGSVQSAPCSPRWGARALRRPGRRPPPPTHLHGFNHHAVLLLGVRHLRPRARQVQSSEAEQRGMMHDSASGGAWRAAGTAATPACAARGRWRGAAHHRPL